MSLLTKAIVTAIFIGLLVSSVYLLPSVDQYPLPPEFASSLALVFQYAFAWSSVFTCLSTLVTVAILAFGIEILFFIWRAVAWIISKVAFFLA